MVSAQSSDFSGYAHRENLSDFCRLGWPLAFPKICPQPEQFFRKALRKGPHAKACKAG